MAEHDKKEALLTAARMVFAHDGYHRATVRDIAHEAGVATGTFYLYFSSKEACLLGLIDAFYHLLVGRIVAARAGRSGVLEKLTASIETVIRVFAAHSDLARIVLIHAHAGGAHPAFDERLAQLHTDFARLVQADLDEAAGDGLIPRQATAVAARAVIGSMYENITAWLREGQPADLEEAVPALVAFNLRGIGGEDFPRAASNTSPRGPSPR